MKFKDFLEDDPVKLNESTLGRIYQHIQKKNIDSWAILTSYRDEKDDKTNKSDFQKLKNKVRSLKCGFIELEGIGQEEKGDEIVNISEPSLFIPKISYKDAKILADTYDQWGFIYSGPEKDDKIALVSKVGTDFIDKFRPNKIAQFYSKIKGKPFTFESIKVSNWIEGLYWQSLK